MSLNTLTKGIAPLLNPAEDLKEKEDSNSNSWFAICHCESRGHVLNFMYHFMIYPLPTGALMNVCFSITDETARKYYGKDQFYPMAMTKMGKEPFSIQVPGGYMGGDLNEMKITAQMEQAAIDVTLIPEGSVLYNGGAGIFGINGITVHQYSIPKIRTSGTIVLDGETYEFNDGVSWFDRQWQQADYNISDSANMFRWTWMDLNLDCGDSISLWSTQLIGSGEEHAWATILHADGSQTTANMTPLTRSQSDFWKSSVSGQNYPTRWLVEIPEVDAKLEVVAVMKEQEIASQFINKYEAASKITGTYKGKPAAGHCYVELLGDFSE